MTSEREAQRDDLGFHDREGFTDGEVGECGRAGAIDDVGWLLHELSGADHPVKGILHHPGHAMGIFGGGDDNGGGLF